VSSTCWDIGTTVLACSAATNVFLVLVLPSEFDFGAAVLTVLAGVQIMTIGWILK